jgi:hypothetical protein
MAHDRQHPLIQPQVFRRPAAGNDGGVVTCVEYDKPSSLFGQFGNTNVTEAATMLDRKLEQLAAEAISIWQHGD